MSEKEIMEKLDIIEKKIDHIKKMEEEQLNKEDQIIKEEEQELGVLKEATKKLQFTDVMEWQKYVWEGCKYKKEIKGTSEIDYYCEKTKAVCKFEGCPMNVIGQDE